MMRHILADSNVGASETYNIEFEAVDLMPCGCFCSAVNQISKSKPK